VKVDSVVNEGPDPHLDVARRENLKVQPRRCHCPEIFCVRKKVKNFRRRSSKPELRLKQVFFHICFIEPFAAISGPPVEYLAESGEIFRLNVNTDGTLDWDHRICDFIEQNRDILK
jgi:hypothetical protein